jgi:hypothetical protein
VAGWHDFFMLIGGAAATLIGLMFVAISFAVGSKAERSRKDLDTWVTPSLFYFLETFLVAACMLAPVGPRLLGALMAVLIGINLPYGLMRFSYLLAQHREESLGFTTWGWQLLLPVGAQVLLVSGAAGLFAGHQLAQDAIAVSTVVLLIISVRNTWYLVVWLLEQR